MQIFPANIKKIKSLLWKAVKMKQLVMYPTT